MTRQTQESKIKRLNTHRNVKRKVKKLDSDVLDSKYIMATYNDFKNTKMSFGKYKGYFLKDVPTTYMKWLIMNIEDRGLCEMYSIELQRRLPSLRKSKI